ncbi:substrate-binding domain-containing protein [Ignavigranum ruoffiae]|uniref:substrate-binding domain-containing protein n=1 Tax=Ignavigranum ruoffiae TaxID=89093 RepID=UPI0024AD0BE4|nr:substrate-binding domain-containing protein [Ignavigranum ruoffiae]
MKKTLPLLSVFGLAASIVAPVFAQEGTINVVSREDGSGTRSAFVEIVGVVNENDDDMTVETAAIQNGTNGVMQTVAQDAQAIGYISLGSLDDSVKAVKVDGVEPSADTIKAGEYPIARPFNVAWSKDSEMTEVTKDFLSFIHSADGQTIVEEEGYIQVTPKAAEGEESAAEETKDEETEAESAAEETKAEETEAESAAEETEAESAAEETEAEGEAAAELPAYEAKEGLEGTIEVVGSTSVSPVMEKLAEKYMELNSGVTINVTSNGSSAGMTAAQDGTADLGMASRELKDEEKEKLDFDAIAMDGIAVIVNKESKVEELSMENIKKIYLGEITTWEDAVK